jgi:hypothetical protein
VRAAGKRRVEEARIRGLLAQWWAREELRTAALKPWSQALRSEYMLISLDPAATSRRLKAMAREMRSTATILDAEARRLVDSGL